jgi:uncharacterized protein
VSQAKPFRVFDADAHLFEGEDAWKYLEPEYEHRRPRPVEIANPPPTFGTVDAFWAIDGHLVPSVGKGAMVSGTPTTATYSRRKPFSTESMELTDVSRRLADMDRLGLDVQVIIPNLLILQLTEDPQFEMALARAYNRWIAETCQQAPARLLWSAGIPLRDPYAAVAELRRVKEAGAVAAAIGGTVRDKMLHEPEFDRFFAAAADLDIPVLVHVSWSFPPLSRMMDSIYAAQCVNIPLTVLMGCFSILAGGILDRHPGLRVAFMEIGSEWLPWLMQRLDEFYRTNHITGYSPFKLPKRNPRETWRECQVYTACEVEEMLLPQIIEVAGADRLLFHSDMPHTEAHGPQDLFERTDVTPAAKQQILWDNAARFFKVEG